MKWGVRRSPAQLARASKTRAQTANAKRKERKDPSTPTGAKIAERKAASSNRRFLDEGDLDAYIRRLEKEKKLKNLVEEDISPGKKASKAILSDTGQRLVKQAAFGAASIAVGAVIANKMGDTTPGFAKDGSPIPGMGKVVPTALDFYKAVTPKKKGG